MNDYPKSFPLPMRNDYSYTVDMGLIRSDLNVGLPIQGREFKTQPHHFNLSFAVPIDAYTSWLNWVNNHGFEWFTIKAFSFLGGPCSDVVMRFTGDLVGEPIGTETLKMSTTAEMYIAGKP